MRPAKFLLPLLPLAGSSLASGQQRFYSMKNCPSAGNVPGSLALSFTSVIFISRALWLETLHLDADKVAKIGDDILGDMLMGTAAVYMHALNLQGRPPFTHPSEENFLFTGFQAWVKQTTEFLKSLASSAEMFHEVAPHLEGELLSNITMFQETATELCHNFRAIVPGIYSNVTEVIATLMTTFEDTRYKLTGSTTKRMSEGPKLI